MPTPSDIPPTTDPPATVAVETAAADDASRARTPRRRRLLPLVLRSVAVAVFVSSLVANVGLFRVAAANYRQLNEGQLDPLGLKHPGYRPDPAGPATGPALPTVVFFGDSRAHGWPFPAVAGYRFVDRGVGGQTTAQVLGRLDAHVCPLRPRAVVVQAGINDLKAIGLFPNRRAEIVADCRANLRAIVGRLAADGSAVVLTTIFPPGKVTLDRRLAWSPDVEAAVGEVNADLRTLAGGRVVVFDA